MDVSVSLRRSGDATTSWAIFNYINESGEAGVVLTEPQRDVLTETALVGFTCPARVVLTAPEWVRFAKK